MRTTGGVVSEGRWRRYVRLPGPIKGAGNQDGCCTFVLHPRMQAWRSRSSQVAAVVDELPNRFHRPGVPCRVVA